MVGFYRGPGRKSPLVAKRAGETRPLGGLGVGDRMWTSPPWASGVDRQMWRSPEMGAIRRSPLRILGVGRRTQRNHPWVVGDMLMEGTQYLRNGVWLQM